MYRNHTITIVIPTLNEEDGIRRVLRAVPEVVDDVIVVDGNSADRTAEVAREAGARVIREDVRGYGRAYKTGFQHAQGDIIITLDGDHSYPIEAVPQLVDIFLKENVDFLSASRFPLDNPHALPALNRLGNLVLSLTLSALFVNRVRDSQSGMWVFYKRVLEQMHLTADGMEFSEEIKIEAIRNPQTRFREVHIDFSQRMGEAKLRPYRDGLRCLLFLLKKRFHP